MVIQLEENSQPKDAAQHVGGPFLRMGLIKSMYNYDWICTGDTQYGSIYVCISMIHQTRTCTCSRATPLKSCTHTPTLDILKYVKYSFLLTVTPLPHSWSQLSPLVTTWCANDQLAFSKTAPLCACGSNYWQIQNEFKLKKNFIVAQPKMLKA